MQYLSRAGHEEPCLNLGRPRSKAKYMSATDSGKYREGTVKRTPARGVKENLKPQDWQDVVARKCYGVSFVE